MLSTKIDTNFPGVNQNSINWMKHYLNGGDDVGASWNGIADSVSGYTYNYSNQFEFDLAFGDLVQSNLASFLVCQSMGTVGETNDGMAVGLLTYSVVSPTYTQTPTAFDITVFRLPYPDLPGAILVRPQGARVQWPSLETTFTAESEFSVVLKTNVNYDSNGFVIPILDPNWSPDFIDLVAAGCNKVTTTASTCFTNQQPYNGSTARRTRGFSEQLAAWRMAGASMTMSIPVSEYYKNGTIVACTSNAPFWTQSDLPVQPYMHETGSSWNQPLMTGVDICTYDLPTSYSEVSSVKNYHKFSAQDGTYVVLHNSQGNFNFYNYESNEELLILPSVNKPTYVAANAKIDMLTGREYISGGYYGLRVVTATGAVTYPICLLRNRTIYSSFISNSCIPVFNIPKTQLSEWDVASVATAINDQDKALQLSLKFNTYAECYISASSSLKPSVSITSPYYPRLLEYLSAFYHTHDGIYPYSWNDGKKVWNTFKRFLQSDALAKMIGMVSPSAGQITSLIQSEVQRLANKQKVKDSKLSKTEKEQVKSIVSSIVPNKKK